MKNKRIHIRITEEEHSEIKHYAYLSGKNISDYVLDLLREDMRRKKSLYITDDSKLKKLKPERKEIDVKVRFTKSGMKTLNERAKLLNVSVSEYVRRSTLQKKIFDFKFIRELTRELRKIGTNLNQLTYKANAGEITVVNLKETKDEIAGIYKELRNLFRKNLY